MHQVRDGLHAWMHACQQHLYPFPQRSPRCNDTCWRFRSSLPPKNHASRGRTCNDPVSATRAQQHVCIEVNGYSALIYGWQQGARTPPTSWDTALSGRVSLKAKSMMCSPPPIRCQSAPVVEASLRYSHVAASLPGHRQHRPMCHPRRACPRSLHWPAPQFPDSVSLVTQRT